MAVTMFLLNFILTITNTLQNGNVDTKIVHRVFAIVPHRMLEDEEFARARMHAILEKMNLPIDDSICAKIMRIVQIVNNGRFIVEMAHLPLASICVTLDHGAVTTVISEVDDEPTE